MTLVLAGCGATAGKNVALTQGNWSVTATPSSGPAFYIGGNLTQSGSSVTGSMYVANSNCFDFSTMIPFTGTVSGQNVTLTSPSVSGQVIVVTATGTAGSLAGTYTVTGGCDGGDSGSATAAAVSSIGGTWNGTIVDSNDDPHVTVAMNLVEASTPSADGTFALTGTLTYTGSTCSVSGNITGGSSFVVGTYLVINGVTTEADESTGNFTYSQAILNSATAPTSMTGGYQETFGLCTDDFPNSATFTKQ